MPPLILVVEDDRDQRELLVELLTDEGYRAVDAATANAALESVARERLRPASNGAP